MFRHQRLSHIDRPLKSPGDLLFVLMIRVRMHADHDVRLDQIVLVVRNFREVPDQLFHDLEGLVEGAMSSSGLVRRCTLEGFAIAKRQQVLVVGYCRVFCDQSEQQGDSEMEELF